MMTRRRIHTIYIALCLFYSLNGIITFTLFLRDFSKQDRCSMFSILKKTAYLAMPVLFFSLGSTFMFVNNVIIICKLTRSKISVSDATSGTSVKIPRNNVKLTRTIIMTLTAYILFFLPIVTVTSIWTIFGTFTDGSLWGILEDIALLFYFSNNFVNPFIYYMTLRDFREGYKRLLFCCVRNPGQGNSTIHAAVIGRKC